MWSAIAYRCWSANFSRANFRAAARTFSGGVGDGIENMMLWTSFTRRAVACPSLGPRYWPADSSRCQSFKSAFCVSRPAIRYPSSVSIAKSPLRLLTYRVSGGSGLHRFTWQNQSNWTVSDRIGCVCIELAHKLVLQVTEALTD